MVDFTSKRIILMVFVIVSVYSSVCESANQDPSDEDTSSISNHNATKSTSAKFPRLTIILCKCNSGEIINDTGQCESYENGSHVPTMSNPREEPKLIDTNEFNVVVREPGCDHPKVQIDDGQFVLRLRGAVDLFVREGNYTGLAVTDYCVNHQLRQGQVIVTAQGCVSTPTVRKCCPLGEYPNNGECVELEGTIATLPFDPPLAVGFGKEGLAGAPFEWEYHIEPLNKPCVPGHVIKEIIKLDGRVVYLAAQPDKVLLTWQPVDSGRLYSPPPNYCVDLGDDNTYNAYLCQEDLNTYCDNFNCLLKCCPKGEALSTENQSCVPNDLPLTIPFPSPSTNINTIYNRYPTCTFGNPNESHPRDIIDFKLTHDGSLIHQDIKYSPVEFCLDNIISDSCPELAALVCISPHEKSTFEVIRLYILPPCMGLSCAFLALLLLLHAWIPKLREKEGKYQLFHAGSLLVGYSITMINLRFASEGLAKYSAACVPLAFVMQFSFLSAFFWLNALCFDVWRLFRNLVNNPVGPVPPIRPWKYMLFGFGGPLIIMVITMIVQFVASRCEPFSGLIHPRIGDIRCWFKDTKETWAYFYGPIAILFIFNLVFIGRTYHYLKIIQKDIINSSDTNSETKKRNIDCINTFWQQFYLLILIAGLWLTEILSSIIPPKEMWLPTDILNSLQGVLIFFVFLSNKKKRGYLKEQLPKLLEFTNIWLEEADAAQADINDHNRKLSKKVPPLKFLNKSSSTSTFNLDTGDSSNDTTTSGVQTLSLTSKTSVDIKSQSNTTLSSEIM